MAGKSSQVWALHALLYQAHFVEPDDTGVLTQILAPAIVKAEQLALIF